MLAVVGMKRQILFLEGSEREKKNEASSSLSRSHNTAIDLATEDFPAPAAPYNHITGTVSSDIQPLILSRTAA